ncbi:MAG: nucleotide exchange factor GrpE [Kofleriaceae bacterium]
MSRALHELEASEARVRRNAERVYDDTRSSLVAELLPVVDNLDRTLGAAIKGQHTDSLIQGVQMVHAQLEQVLRRYGVERIDATGKRFDPVIHEALAAVPVTNPGLVGMVIDQAEAGYRCGSRMLRAAKVTVGVAR